MKATATIEAGAAGTWSRVNTPQLKMVFNADNVASVEKKRLLQMSPSQLAFMNLPNKFRAFVGGFGSGKTFTGCLDLLTFAMKHPGVVQGYFAPTYALIRDIFYPTIAEAGELLGLTVKVSTGNKEVMIYRGGIYYGCIICRTMDNPANIVGFKIARALCDEMDVLTLEKAQAAWVKIIARLRLEVKGVTNGVGITTTPEGFKWVFQTFANEPGDDYGMVRSRTLENARHLPPDYVPSLFKSYTPQLVLAYLDGRFVNLTTGTVYHAYDRLLNKSHETVQPDDTLFIGLDFNVNNMAGVVHVKREARDTKTGVLLIDTKPEPHAVDEFIGLLDTPAMIATIKYKYPEHKIIIYPDSSGKNRHSSNASTSDLKLLKDAGFTIRVKSVNPFVRDRVTSVNSMFLNAEGKRRYKVNDDKCPVTANNLEQQVYDPKTREPDKKSGTDHSNDGLGYFIAHDYHAGRDYSGGVPIKMF